MIRMVRIVVAAILVCFVALDGNRSWVRSSQGKIKIYIQINNTVVVIVFVIVIVVVCPLLVALLVQWGYCPWNVYFARGMFLLLVELSVACGVLCYCLSNVSIACGMSLLLVGCLRLLVALHIEWMYGLWNVFILLVECVTCLWNVSDACGMSPIACGTACRMCV